ncbi:MAG: hypothetical protein J5501_05995 [Ruminococcus sp.]|nr:hypothetical protein [Ruminococcus sp.]
MKKYRITAAAAAMALSAAMMTTFTAGAATTYTPVAGGETEFDKYLVMDEGANVPNVTFEYTITAGTAQPFSEGGKTIAVYAGPDPDKIVFSGTDITDETTTDAKFEIEFAQGDTTTLAAAVTDSDQVKNLDSGEKYAKKTATLDFSAVTFDEPGIYRYIITETNSAKQGIVYDSDLTRVLDVYVEDITGTDGTPTLQVAAYILHATEEATISLSDAYGSDGNVFNKPTDPEAPTVDPTAPTTAEDLDYKSQGFTNEYTSYDLVFSKAVSGNQASKDKYFEFTVTIENAVPGTQFDVSYQDDNNAATTDGDADKTIAANPNSATTVLGDGATQPDFITVGDNGTVTKKFYLQHGQKIAIRGLAEGTKYTIVDGKEDYKPSYATDDEKDTTTDKLDTAKNTAGIEQDVKVDFTNTRDGQIPTGIILSVAAPAVIGIITLAGISVLVYRNRRRETEED